MDDDILSKVRELVDEEHALRARAEAGTVELKEEHQRLRRLEESLDQCWDLLRQREARSEAGQDPNQAKPRGVNEVEGYLQ
ncbi:MAG: hypothetical protein QOF35_337 [Actinomycetota bacterium]|jgi:hypothetical protein|nr:hypothetical protein [Actinomycetota bacterium]